MNKDRIAELLKEPSRVAREDLAGLKEITAKYPWFSGAQLLQAIGHGNTGDVLGDGSIASAAAHLPSREVLFDEVERAKRNGEGQATPHATPLDEFQAPGVPNGPATPADLHNDIAQRILEQQILEAAAASAYELTQPELAGTTAISKPPADDVAMAPAGTEAEALPVAVHSRMRFGDWLSLALPQAEVPVPQRGTEGSAVDVGDWVRETVDQVPDGIPSSPAIPSAARPDTSELIDRFIQRSMPAPQRKAEFFDPQEAGRRSLNEQADLVTETLARIYEKQGHLGKAIAAYTRLAAKHPDRSTYFLALAKGLEERGGNA